MDKDNILQSQEQFVEKAFKSFEGNRLLNTLMKILKGTVASLPDTAKLAESCAKLLPLIAKLLGF
jgi:hypothetical protein